MERLMRCKLRLTEVSILQVDNNGKPTAVKVKFGAVYEQDEKKRNDPASENAIFGKYTPHGYFEGSIYNEHLAPLLVAGMGQEFYTDFTPAPKA